MEFNKHQVNLYAGGQSYSLRTNDEEEIKAFLHEKAAKILDFLRKLDNHIKPKQPPANAPKTAIDGPIKCQFCQGETWDNRTNKKTPKHPDFKCKSCGGAAWVQKSGNLSWKPGQKSVEQELASDLPF